MDSKMPELVVLQNLQNQVTEPAVSRNLLLVRPPYFTPWTPPLGIGILKAFLNQSGHNARCFDFNADPEAMGNASQVFLRPGRSFTLYQQ